MICDTGAGTLIRQTLGRRAENRCGLGSRKWRAAAGGGLSNRPEWRNIRDGLGPIATARRPTDDRSRRDV